MKFIKRIHLIIALVFMLTVKIGNAKQFNGSIDLANVELDKVLVNGSAELKSSKFQFLIVNGALNFKDLIVSNTIEINGAANGENIESHNLIVAGSLEGYRIKVTKGTVSGYLHAHNSDFEELEFDSKNIILNNSMARNIIFKSSKNKVKQKLVLQGKTIVNGDIIFKSGLGEVLLDSQAKLTGKIIGGKVVSS